MMILGIDPGIAIVGWGVVECKSGVFRTIAYGAITTDAGIDVEERLYTIYKELNEVIACYHPDEMAIEELFFNTNITTGIAVAEARGVILLCGRQNRIAIAEYTPLQVKQAITGYGRAEKKQMMTMVASLLKLRQIPKPDDTADALALAVCHGHTRGSKLAAFYNEKKTKLR